MSWLPRSVCHQILSEIPPNTCFKLRHWSSWTEGIRPPNHWFHSPIPSFLLFLLSLLLVLKSPLSTHHRTPMVIRTSPWLTAATHMLFLLSLALCASRAAAIRGKRAPHHEEPLTYIWPLPVKFTFGHDTLSVDPALSLVVDGNGGNSAIVRAAFDRYKGIIFKRSDKFSFLRKLRERLSVYDVGTLRITVHSESEEVGFGYW